MKLTAIEHNQRILETIESLCATSPTHAQATMRARYGWSRRTWFNYQAKAYERLRADAPPLDDARARHIARLEADYARATTDLGRARITAQIADVQGFKAPQRADVCVLHADVPPLRSLTHDPEAMRLRLALEDRLALPDAPDPSRAQDAPARAPGPFLGTGTAQGSTQHV